MVLPIEEFAYHDNKTRKRRNQCKACQRLQKYNRRHANLEKVKEIKSTMQCRKCGESRWYLLDFHHIDSSSKTENVSDLAMQNSMNVIKHEIAKCIPLCSNCHREYHHLNKEYGTALDDYLTTDIISKRFETI